MNISCPKSRCRCTQPNTVDLPALVFRPEVPQYAVRLSPLMLSAMVDHSFFPGPERRPSRYSPVSASSENKSVMSASWAVERPVVQGGVQAVVQRHLGLLPGFHVLEPGLPAGKLVVAHHHGVPGAQLVGVFHLA